LRQQSPAWFDRAVSRAQKFFRYWLPVLIWMFLIFSASADSNSGPTSSRLIGPVVRFFFPEISPENLDQIVFVVRKAAHVSEYAVLSWLLARAFMKPGTPPGAWSRKAAVFAWLIAALYSSSDEFHQSFVPNREARSSDVLIDSAGAALGVVVFFWFGRFRGYWGARRIK
jgi:VanZ family protein